MRLANTWLSGNAISRKATLSADSKDHQIATLARLQSFSTLWVGFFNHHLTPPECCPGFSGGFQSTRTHFLLPASSFDKKRYIHGITMSLCPVSGDSCHTYKLESIKLNEVFLYTSSFLQTSNNKTLSNINSNFRTDIMLVSFNMKNCRNYLSKCRMPKHCRY